MAKAMVLSEPHLDATAAKSAKHNLHLSSLALLVVFAFLTGDHLFHLPGVLVAGRLLQPLDVAAEADGHLDESIGRRRAMPMDDVRCGVVAVAEGELLHWLPFLLGA